MWSKDYKDSCWQSDVSAFNMLSRFVSFSSKEQGSFNFMASVTIHSDFGVLENKICHCLHFFPSSICCAWRVGTGCRDLHFLHVLDIVGLFVCLFVSQTEGLWQPCREQVYWCHFSHICSLHVSVAHCGNSHNTSNLFVISMFVMVICDQWSLMSLSQKDYDSLKLMVSIFSNEVFLN